VSNIIQFTDRVLKASAGLTDMVNTCPGIENTPISGLLTKLSERISNKNKFSFEIVLLNNPTETLWNSIQAFTGIKEEFNVISESLGNSNELLSFSLNESNLDIDISIYSSANIPVRQSGANLPEVKIICFAGDDKPNPEELELVELKLTKDPGIIITLSEEPFELNKVNERLSMVHYTPSIIQSFNVFQYLEEKNLFDFISNIRLFNQMQSLNSINTVFTQYLSQIDNELKSKKITIQYDSNEVKIDEKINYRDRFQKLKTSFQKDFTEIERKIIENAAVLVRPSTNGLIAKIESKIDAIQKLDEQAVGDKIKMTVPSSFKLQLITEIKDTLSNQIQIDLFNTSEVVRENFETIKAELSILQPNSKIPDFKPITDVHAVNMINDFTDFSNRYEIEKKKLGPTDYVRAGMAPIMAVFSLSTLYMVVSGTRKNMGTMFADVKVRIIGILVIGISLYLFIRKVKKSGNHLYDTELEKIQTGMKSEIRSSLKRLSDEWIRSYSSQIREETVRYMSEVEAIFNDLTENHRDQLLKNQRSTQRKVQSIEQEDRIFQNNNRNKENFERAFAQVKTDITQFYDVSCRNINL
jgi:hypothetical protein